MEHIPQFRITEDDVDDVDDLRDHIRDHIHDQSLIDAFASWVNRGDELDSLIRQIEEAFAGLTLGSGVGLLEAEGRDDYASKEERAELRSRDEHIDWRRIDIKTLTRCYDAPIFMDARGFIFHLPAFAIAELNDDIDADFLYRLFAANEHPEGWISLLNHVQRDAIASILSLIAEHPNYRDHVDDIAMAINRLQDMDD